MFLLKLGLREIYISKEKVTFAEIDVRLISLKNFFWRRQIFNKSTTQPGIMQAHAFFFHAGDATKRKFGGTSNLRWNPLVRCSSATRWTKSCTGNAAFGSKRQSGHETSFGALLLRWAACWVFTGCECGRVADVGAGAFVHVEMRRLETHPGAKSC